MLQHSRTFSSASAHLRSRAPAPVCQSSAQRLFRARPADVSRGWQSFAAAAPAVQQQHRAQVQPCRVQQPAWVCRSSIASQATPEPIPDGEAIVAEDASLCFQSAVAFGLEVVWSACSMLVALLPPHPPI